MRSMKDYYTTKYRGGLFVIKAGGRMINDEASRRSLLTDIKDVVDAGIKVLLVYGGGQAIDRALEAANITPRKVDGRRITGPQEMQHIKRVMSVDIAYKLNTSMAALGLDGLVMSALPPSWVSITPRPRDNAQDYGYDGTIDTVQSDAIRNLFKTQSFIATPCLSVTEKDGININADNVAVALAAGAKVRKLIFLTDVDGVLKNGQTIPFMTDSDVAGLITEGTVQGGMQVKLENCVDALNAGVKRIHLIDGFKPNALAKEIFDSTGSGTMLIREADKQSYLNEIETDKVLCHNI